MKTTANENLGWFFCCHVVMVVVIVVVVVVVVFAGPVLTMYNNVMDTRLDAWCSETPHLECNTALAQ